MLHGYVQQLGLIVQELRNHGKVVVGIPETSPNIIIHDLGLGEASMYLMIFYEISDFWDRSKPESMVCLIPRGNPGEIGNRQGGVLYF